MEISVAPRLDPKKFEGDAPPFEDKPVRENGTINKEYYDKFVQSILDQQKDYPPPPTLINLVNGGDAIPILTEISFSLFQGKAKSKKTVTLILFVAAYLRHRLSNDNIYLEGVGTGTVLWFDNEQGQHYASRTMQLILKLAGLEKSDRLIYCDLRRYTPGERLGIIQAAIESTPGIKLVVIDGLIDLLVNWREPEESHALFTKILNWCATYQIHIAGVLHQNKADKNAREIVGTIASQKCEIEIMAEVDPDDKARSIISCTNPRGLPFEPFAIRWDKGALPTIDQEYKQPLSRKEVNNQRAYETGKRISGEVFKPFAPLRFTEAKDAIAKAEKVSLGSAENRLKSYLAWGFIEQGADGLYRIRV